MTADRFQILSRFSEVNQLRERLSQLRTGESSLVSMAGKRIMSRAFFPGGNGLFLGEDAAIFPTGGPMILGSNFGAESNFCTSTGELKCDDETSNAGTWQGLRRRFTQKELEECFFTNAWPFLHVGVSNNPTSEEKQKWLKEPTLGDCLEFLHFTINVVRPSVIITLGTAPAVFMSFAFPIALSAWRGGTWSSIDTLPYTTVSVGASTIICIAMTHPSMSNVHSRRQDLRDEAALTQKAKNLVILG